MSPKPQKGVPVTLDKERHLRYPLAVLKEIQDAGGGLEMFSRFLYLGLKHEDPDLTEAEIEEMIDLAMIPELAGPLKKATGGLIDMDSLMGTAGNLVAPEEGATKTDS